MRMALLGHPDTNLLKRYCKGSSMRRQSYVLEPFTLGAALYFLAKIAIGAVLAVGTVVLLSDKVDGLGDVEVALDSMRQRTSNKVLIRNVVSDREERIESVVDFDVEYKWNETIDRKTYESKLRSLVMKGTETNISKYTGTSVSFRNGMRVISSVKLDPKLGDVWELVTIDEIHVGKIKVTMQTSKKIVEIPYEVVVARRVEARPIKEAPRQPDQPIKPAADAVRI